MFPILIKLTDVTGDHQWVQAGRIIHMEVEYSDELDGDCTVVTVDNPKVDSAIMQPGDDPTVLTVPAVYHVQDTPEAIREMIRTEAGEIGFNFNRHG